MTMWIASLSGMNCHQKRQRLARIGPCQARTKLLRQSHALSVVQLARQRKFEAFEKAPIGALVLVSRAPIFKPLAWACSPRGHIDRRAKNARIVLRLGIFTKAQQIGSSGSG